MVTDTKRDPRICRGRCSGCNGLDGIHRRQYAGVVHALFDGNGFKRGCHANVDRARILIACFCGIVSVSGVVYRRVFGSAGQGNALRRIVGSSRDRRRGHRDGLTVRVDNVDGEYSGFAVVSYGNGLISQNGFSVAACGIAHNRHRRAVTVGCRYNHARRVQFLAEVVLGLCRRGGYGNAGNGGRWWCWCCWVWIRADG